MQLVISALANSPLSQNPLGFEGSSVIDKAIAYWRAKNYSGSGDLLDLSGNGHNAAITGPIFLPFSGTQYAFFPGDAANNISVPDSVPLSITGDIDLRIQVALPDWTPAASTDLLTKWTAAGNNRAYGLVLLSTGVLQLTWSTSGGVGGVETADSTVATGITDGAKKWVRATLDVDDGGGNRLIEFFTSDNGVDWTQLGTTVTVGVTTSIDDGTALVQIGAAGIEAALLGDVYRAQILNGIDGTVELDVDFTVPVAPFTSFVESSSNAATVTINRSAAGDKLAIVDRSLFLMSNDEELTVTDDADLDFAAGESLTLFTVNRMYRLDVTQPLATTQLNPGVANLGYTLNTDGVDSIAARISDGTFDPEDISPVVTVGQIFSVALRRDVVADEVEAFLNGVGSGSPTTDTTTGTLNSTRGLVFGSYGIGAFDGEWFAGALFREALTDAEMALVSDFLLTP